MLFCKYTNPLLQLTKYPAMWFHNSCEEGKGKPQGYKQVQFPNYAGSRLPEEMVCIGTFNEEKCEFSDYLSACDHHRSHL